MKRKVKLHSRTKWRYDPIGSNRGNERHAGSIVATRNRGQWFICEVENHCGPAAKRLVALANQHLAGYDVDKLFGL